MSDLLDQLRGDGRAAASGALALDRAKAREKLQKFRLPDPHHYVLQLVRAASAAGATRIAFMIEATSMECVFDRELPEEMLRNLWDHAFGERTTNEQQAAYYLALGLGSAQALNPKFIDVTSGAVRLKVERDSEEVISAGDETAAWVGVTRIRLQEKFSLGHVADFLKSLVGELNEVRALRSYCAYAAIELFVNGEEVQSPLDDFMFDQCFEMPEGRLRMAVDLLRPTPGAPMGYGAEGSKLVLLCDGVKVGEWTTPGYGARYLAAFDSPLLVTDLSGSKLVEDQVIERKLTEVATERHLSMLADWAEGKLPLRQLPEELTINLLERVGRRVSFLRREQLPVSEDTQRLYDWLMAQRLFEAIDGTGEHTRSEEKYSVKELTRDGRILYTRTTFRDIVLPGQVVADLSQFGPAANALADALLVQHAPPNVIVADAEGQLADRAKYERNREQWSQQPVTGLSQYRLGCEVKAGPYRGRVQIPSEGVGHPIIASELGLRVYLEGKLLRAQELRLPLPLLIEIDGEFQVDSIHADIAVDANVERLFEEVVRAIPGLVDKVADRAVQEDGPLWHGFFTSWLQIVHTGTWTAGTASPEQTYRKWRASFELSCAFGKIRPVPPERGWGPAGLKEFVQRLGRIASVRQFTVAGSNRRESLRSMLESGRSTIPVLAQRDDWEMLLPLADKVDGGPIIVVSPDLADVLLGLHTLFVDARPSLNRIGARQKFLRKPNYRRSGNTLASSVSETGELRAEVDLLDAASGDETEHHQSTGILRVDVLHEGRLLQREVVGTEAGTFRAVVTGEVLPRDDYAGSRAMLQGVKLATEAASKLLDDWWMGVVERQGIPDSALGLFMQRAVDIAREHRSGLVFTRFEHYPTKPTFPVWGVSGERRWMSVSELDAAIRDAGGSLRYVTGSTLPEGISNPAAPILLLGSNVTTEDLRAAFPDAVLADVRHADSATVQPALQRHMAQEPYTFTVLGEGPVWSGQYEGVELFIRWVPIETWGGPHHVVGDVLWEDRPLERLGLEVPLCNFRFVARSSAFEPGPYYATLRKGRGRLEEALRRGVTQCVTEVVNRFDELGRGEPITQVLGLAARVGKPETAELVRRDLLRGISRLSEFGEDWAVLAEVVRRARVFRTAAGSCLSLDELDLIAKNGVIEATDFGISDQMLQAPIFLADYRAAVSRRYVIEWVEGWKQGARAVADTIADAGRRATSASIPDGATNPDEDASTNAIPGPPPLLASVRRKLLEVRGTRVDLLSDALLTRWSFADATEPDDLVDIRDSHLTVERNHLLWRRLEQAPDEVSLAFMTSVIFTSVNRHYVEVTDHHDAEFQTMLLSHVRDNGGAHHG